MIRARQIIQGRKVRPVSSRPDTVRRRGTRQHKAARTAWLIGGIALAFYVIALVLGHFGHLNTSWKTAQPTTSQTTSATISPRASHPPALSQP